MNDILHVLQCALRIALAIFLGFTVVGEFFRTDPLQIGWYVSPRQVELSTAMICALLAAISIWLVFGVRTRVVALLGLALYVGLEVVRPGLHAASYETIMNSTFVVLLGLPLVLFGGGKFSMIRAGWRGAI